MGSGGWTKLRLRRGTAALLLAILGAAGCAGPPRPPAAVGSGAVAGLATAAIAVRQARRLINSQIRGMFDVTTLAARALEKTRRDASMGLAKARTGSRSILICDYAVDVDSDALEVSAYANGLSADTGSLTGALANLNHTTTALSAQLRVVLRGQPGYQGGPAAPSPAQVAAKISRAAQRTSADLGLANGYVALLNRDVAAAYRLSARTSTAAGCRTASAPPAPLRPVPVP